MNDQLPPPSVPTPQRSGRSRRVLAASVGAGLLAGGAIGFAAGLPDLTSAATPAVVDEPAADEPATDEPATDPTGFAPGERLRETLQPLVDDGTIDSGQADEVARFLAGHWAEQRAEHRAEHGPRRGGPDHRPIREAVDSVVEVLGVDAETVRDELRAGSSLADIAASNDVDPQVLIDALVAEAEAMLDRAVAAGRIDAERADERRADLEDRITARVNGELPERPNG